MISLDISDKVRLFDSMILPILCYGSELWGFHKAVDIERVHTKFLKQLLSFKVILYSYLILKKMNERITDNSYINKYT